MTIAVYAGSFDPVTLGHLDLIARSSRRFSHLIVAVGENSAKSTLFDGEERIALIEGAMKWDCYVERGSVSVKRFSGMLVDFCQRELATVIVRGLRAVTDFESEMAIAHTNDALAGIDTVFFPTRNRHSFVASSIVKEIARYSTTTGWRALTQYCPENVIQALRRKYDKTWTDQQENK